MHQKMQVHIQSSTIINHGNNNDIREQPNEVPLTIFDLFASNIHIAVLYAFTPPTPTNSELINGLSKTLVHFPTLMASLHYDHLNNPHLLHDGGALVVETAVSSKLSDHLPLEPSPEFLLLHPSIDKVTDHLFQVQLNRFQCGGLVIAATAHHRVADGQSMSLFFTAWAQTVRGDTVDRYPIYDQSWLQPRNPPRCEFEHWNIDFADMNAYKNGLNIAHEKNADPINMTNILLHYSLDFITSELKPKVKAKYTTFETLLAHVWRKITEVRRLDDDENTMLRVTVNGRPRLRPPVPSEFFGNLVLNAYPKETARELLDGGIEHAAKIIHEGIKMIDEKYIQSFIDFGAIHAGEEIVPVYDTEGNVLSPILEVDCWLRFRFQDVDFGGGGKLCAFLPTWLPNEGLVIFLPSLTEDGGIDVFVTLLKDHAWRLRKIAHSVD